MEVTLAEILAAREKRAQRQKQLLEQFQKPLVCFTMNIAGPVKNSKLITGGFHLGQRLLTAQLDILRQEQVIAATGCEGYYIVSGDAVQIKRLTAQLEDSMPIGRLFDMDVLTPDGRKLSREDIHLPGRKCLLCDRPAHICGRSRAHSVEALQAETTRRLQDALWEQDAQRIAAKAVQALLYEVCTTPKPGLVDCQNSGSHTDMDLFTFLASGASLSPYFARCARIGMQTADLSPAETFSRLRLPGKLAEQTMYEATGGINTHKGAIFTLGLLCGAAGRLESRYPEDILDTVKAMTQGLAQRDFAGVTEENAATNGQKLYVRYGITGVRGLAEAGFPAVLETGLPVLKQGLAQGRSLNDAGSAALLHLLAATVDTNLIARGDLSTQQQTTKKIAELLAKDPYPTQAVLAQLDREFIERNLSPGGSADLLAATYFLYFLA